MVSVLSLESEASLCSPGTYFPLICPCPPYRLHTIGKCCVSSPSPDVPFQMSFKTVSLPLAILSDRSTTELWDLQFQKSDQIWKNFGQVFFNYFSSPFYLRNSSYTYFRLLEIIPNLPMSCSFSPSIFSSLCFILESFYCCLQVCFLTRQFRKRFRLLL